MNNKYEELKKHIEFQLGMVREAFEKDAANDPKRMFDRGAIFAYECMMTKIKHLDEEG